MEREMSNGVVDRAPMKPSEDPGEVASAALFLASHKARSVAAPELAIDGGSPFNSSPKTQLTSKPALKRPNS
jgi:NAD(P)-dependent dehydrogenase (short-subunit alcohol dehydrogenase family)